MRIEWDNVSKAQTQCLACSRCTVLEFIMPAAFENLLCGKEVDCIGVRTRVNGKKF